MDLPTIKDIKKAGYKSYTCIKTGSFYEDPTLSCLTINKGQQYLISDGGYVCFNEIDDMIPMVIAKVKLSDIDKYFEIRKLKRSHKALMIIEAGFIYCERHNLNNDTFIDDVFMSESFDQDGGEFGDICDDLRHHRYNSSYKLKTVTNEEYERCVDKFEKL